MDVLHYAIAALGCIAFLPISCCAIGAARRARRERRRAAMFARFDERIGL